MNMPERNDGDFPRGDRVREVAELFRQAECAIKMAEELHAHIPFSAINELRYAGRHLTEWLAQKGEEELDKAVRHCRRATYDAHEAQLLYYLEEIRKFKNDYRNIVISEVVASYGEILHEIRQAQDEINRMRNADMDKAELYRQLAGYVAPIARNCLLLDSHREELNKKIRKERLQVVTCWAAIIGAALAFASFVLYQAAH